MQTNLIEVLTSETLNGNLVWTEDQSNNIDEKLWSYTTNGVKAVLYELNRNINRHMLIVGEGSDKLIFSDVNSLVYAIKNGERIHNELSQLEKFMIGIAKDVQENKKQRG